MLLKDRFDLSDEIVAVTGGSGVLMSGMAEALAMCGARGDNQPQCGFVRKSGKPYP